MTEGISVTVTGDAEISKMLRGLPIRMKKEIRTEMEGSVAKFFVETAWANLSAAALLSRGETSARNNVMIEYNASANSLSITFMDDYIGMLEHGERGRIAIATDSFMTWLLEAPIDPNVRSKLIRKLTRDGSVRLRAPPAKSGGTGYKFIEKSTKEAPPIVKEFMKRAVRKAIRKAKVK